MVGLQRPQFVLFGSSIVQKSFSDGGWGSILADIYARKADILLRGYNGWNSRRAIHVLDKIFPKDAAMQPALIIVYFGGNDSMKPFPSELSSHVPLQEYHVPIPEYVENMRKIAKHVMSLSESIRLIFLTPPPVNEAQIQGNMSPFSGERIRTNDLIQMYSEACIELCQDMGVKVIDLWSAIQRREDWLTTCFTDGIHLSAEGSEIVVKEILDVLKEAEWMPSLYWESMPIEFAEYSPHDCVPSGGKTTLKPSEWIFHREAYEFNFQKFRYFDLFVSLSFMDMSPYLSLSQATQDSYKSMLIAPFLGTPEGNETQNVGLPTIISRSKDASDFFPFSLPGIRLEITAA